MLNFRIEPEFFVYPYLEQNSLKPYTQIIDQHFPGGFFLPINFATLGFTTPDSFLRLHVLLVTLICFFIFKITKNIFSVLLFLAFWSFFDGGHLWVDTFVALFALSAYYFSTQKKWLSTGISIAMAVLFKQSLVLLTLPFLLTSPLAYLPTLLLIIYFSAIFNFRDFWYITGVFNITGYAGKAFFLERLPKWIFIFTPTIILIKKYSILFFFLAVTLIGFLARPDTVHLQPAAPFLILLLFYFFRHYAPKLLIPYTVLMLLLSIFKETRLVNNRPVDYEDNTQKVIDYVKNNTVKQQEIFLLGAQPQIYFYTNTLPAGKYFVYQLPWYMNIYENNQLAVLQNYPPKFIVYDTTSGVDNIPITFYAPKLIDFTLKNYRPTQTFGNYVVYEKIDL